MACDGPVWTLQASGTGSLPSLQIFHLPPDPLQRDARRCASTEWPNSYEDMCIILGFYHKAEILVLRYCLPMILHVRKSVDTLPKSCKLSVTLLVHTAGMYTIFRTTVCLHQVIYRAHTWCSRGCLEAIIMSALTKDTWMSLSENVQGFERNVWLMNCDRKCWWTSLVLQPFTHNKSASPAGWKLTSN